MAPITSPQQPASNNQSTIIDQISMIAQVIGALASIIALIYFIYYRPYRRNATPRPILIRIYGRQRIGIRRNARTRPPATRSSSRGLQAAGRSNSSETLVADTSEDDAKISFMFPRFFSFRSFWVFKRRSRGSNG